MSLNVPEMENIYATGRGGILSKDVPLREFMYLVFTRTRGELL